MKEKLLTLEQIKRLSTDDIVNHYRNGYKLSGCKNCLGATIRGLSPASCIESIVQKTTRTISLSVNAGTPPYTLHFLVDGVEKTVAPTWSGNNVTFSYTFIESLGNHTYGTYIIYNCGVGSLSSNTDSCTINIVSLQPGNLVLNPDFQIATTPGIPDNWYMYQTGNTAIFTYPDTERFGGSSKSVSIEYITLEPGQFAQVGQNIGTITSGNYYLLTGWMMTQNVAGEVGATIQINWNDSTDKYLSSSFINAVVGTTPWAQYIGTVQAPPNASKGFVVLQLYQSSGKAYFTDISFMVTTAPTCIAPIVTMTI